MLDLRIRRQAGEWIPAKLVAGVTAPDASSVALGTAVVLSYFAQHSMERFDDDATFWETLEKAFPQMSVGLLRAPSRRSP